MQDGASFTVKELLGDLKDDIAGLDRKVEQLTDDLDNKFEEHERLHGVELMETIRSRNDPAFTAAHRSLQQEISEVKSDLTRQMGALTDIVRIHENRWQRIIGVLLVLTFLGVSSLLSIVVLLWGVLNSIGA